MTELLDEPIKNEIKVRVHDDEVRKPSWELRIPIMTGAGLFYLKYRLTKGEKIGTYEFEGMEKAYD